MDERKMTVHAHWLARHMSETHGPRAPDVARRLLGVAERTGDFDGRRLMEAVLAAMMPGERNAETSA
jgi:hypothetical protein